jgi:hypothetical protein
LTDNERLISRKPSDERFIREERVHLASDNERLT